MLPAQQQLNCRHSASNKLSRNTYFHYVRPTVRHVPCSTWHTKCCPPTVTAAAAPTPGHLQQPHGSISRTADASQQHSIDSSSKGSWWSRLDWELLLLASALPVPSALAEEGLTYDSSRGEGIVKTLSGGLYIGLLLYFLFKVLNRRARKAREERLAGQGPVRTIFTTWIEKATEGKERPQATAGAAFIGAVQAGLIGYGLFMFATRVEGQVYTSSLPDAYTARNVAITVRTIIVGLMYLATFIFSANALGLTGLGFQLLFFPDSLPDDEPSPSSRLPKEPQLPKVTVTSSPEEIKAAFAAVARAQNGSSSNGSMAAGSSSGSSSSSSSNGSSPLSSAAEEGTADADSSSSSKPSMAGATSTSDSS